MLSSTASVSYRPIMAEKLRVVKWNMLDIFFIKG